MGGMDDGEEVVLWGSHDDIAPSIGCCPSRFRMQMEMQIGRFDRRQKSYFFFKSFGRLEEISLSCDSNRDCDNVRSLPRSMVCPPSQ